MIDVQGPRCETCKFFFVDGEATVCRRYPPTMMLMETKRLSGNIGEGMKGLAYSSQAVFPHMLPSAWCGEHQPS